MPPKKKNKEFLTPADLPERRLSDTTVTDIAASFIGMMNSVVNSETHKHSRMSVSSHPLATWVSRMYKRPVSPEDELAIYTHHVKGPDMGSLHTLSFAEFMQVPKIVDKSGNPLPIPIGLIMGTSTHLTMAERSIVWLTMTDSIDNGEPQYDIRTYNARSKSVIPYPPVLYDHLRHRITSVDHGIIIP